MICNYFRWGVVTKYDSIKRKMTKKDITELILKTEPYNFVFYPKADIDNDSVLSDIIAFLNAEGGYILIGADQNLETIHGITEKEKKAIENLLYQMSIEQIKPAVDIDYEPVKFDEKTLLLIKVDDGQHKPYCDNNAVFWIKSKSHKQYLKTNKNFRQLFQLRNNTFFDQHIIEHSGIDDFNYMKFEIFFETHYPHLSEQLDIPIEKLLENMKLMQDGHLNLTALVLFGKNPQKFFPECYLKACCYSGKKAIDEHCTDFVEIRGTIDNQLKEGVRFFTHHIPDYTESILLTRKPLLLNKKSFEEMLQNALIHRDYARKKPIELCIFKNRIEIISPGQLPEELSVSNIHYGNVFQRNQLLASYAAKMMAYKYGFGIISSLREYPQIVFINDTVKRQFKSVIYRPESKKQ